ncbi:hemagglutinin [Leptospira perolatii]|uniref:Hemagglutinin n=1 Tax=Leptospira perolatii TaxID=2023191 RepID=A0A2M9ZMS8_9LEPT|nr:hemagglutinin [Leptospira perolatii]PJZ68268.1 hemagglutinin [Leptospira perolatii]PJZ73382.1 hemagglutinin [Leptospira perolatii]
MQKYSIAILVLLSLFSYQCELKDKNEASEKLLRQLVNGSATPSSNTANGNGGSTYFKVGGAISGLGGGKSITLANNIIDTSPFFLNGPFQFPFSYQDAGTYAVSITVQPVGQTCTLANQNGAISGADVTSVIVMCGP